MCCRHAQSLGQPLPTSFQTSFAEHSQLERGRRPAGGPRRGSAGATPCDGVNRPDHSRRSGPWRGSLRGTSPTRSIPTSGKIGSVIAVGAAEAALVRRSWRPATTAALRAARRTRQLSRNCRLLTTLRQTFVDGPADSGGRKKPPRIVLRAADRPPDERRIQLPQITRLAIAAKRHLVNQIEADLLRATAGQPDRPGDASGAAPHTTRHRGSAPRTIPAGRSARRRSVRPGMSPWVSRCRRISPANSCSSQITQVSKCLADCTARRQPTPASDPRDGTARVGQLEHARPAMGWRSRSCWIMAGTR